MVTFIMLWQREFESTDLMQWKMKMLELSIAVFSLQQAEQRRGVAGWVVRGIGKQSCYIYTSAGRHPAWGQCGKTFSLLGTTWTESVIMFWWGSAVCSTPGLGQAWDDFCPSAPIMGGKIFFCSSHFYFPCKENTKVSEVTVTLVIFNEISVNRFLTSFGFGNVSLWVSPLRVRLSPPHFYRRREAYKPLIKQSAGIVRTYVWLRRVIISLSTLRRFADSFKRVGLSWIFQRRDVSTFIT